MSTLSHVNGHSQSLVVTQQDHEDNVPAPRFTFDAADLSPPIPERETRNPEPATERQPAAEKPADSAPPRSKKRRNSLRDSQERVSDMKQLLPRKVPRRRDLKIYEYVVFQRITQQTVAEIYGITQERVCQIVREIRAWKATVPYEIPGMTEQQQINLATHETRRWLEIIRDKCLEKVDQTSCGETKTYFDVNKNTTHRTISERSVSPKPGFMTNARAAVIQAGKLAGAGEQWMRNRVQSPKSKIQSPDDEMTNDQIPMTDEDASALSSEPPQVAQIANPKSEIPNHPTAANLQSANARPRVPSDPQSNGRLLKKKISEIPPQSGKSGGHKASAFRRQAQVERARRKKIRESAYNSAAEAEQIAPDNRPRFCQLLRELDRIADRVEDRVEAAMKADRILRTPEERKALVHRLRRQTMEMFLRVSGELLTPPYDECWVWDRYNPDTGRFWWQEEGGDRRNDQ